jgi:peroxiredoxin
MLLRDRSADLAAAGVRALAISRDSPWSHAAWASALGIDVPLLSDWNGEVIRAFGVAFEPLGMEDVAMRSAFLIEEGESVLEAWMLGGELPDVDAVIAASRATSG